MSQVPLTACMMGVEVQDIFAAHFADYAAKHVTVIMMIKCDHFRFTIRFIFLSFRKISERKNGLN